MFGPLLWRCLPNEMKARLRYAQQLATDLYVPLPVPTKRAFISHTQRVLGYPTFVETGTFLGHMSRHASGLFQTVHTIELSQELASLARKALTDRPNVTVHQGDSGAVLRELLPAIRTPCVFWLDGHYSGGRTARGETDTPIAAELENIADHNVRPHAVLIDDARVFGVDDAYPTLEEVFARLRDIDPGFKVGVSSDIIWAAPIKLLHFEWRRSPSGGVIAPTSSPGCLPER